MQQTLGRLKAAGLPLLLDDFGTGYASLTYLQRFRFDGIKIDREFVSGLPDSEQSVALVRASSPWPATLDCMWWPKGWRTSVRRPSCASTAAPACRASTMRDRSQQRSAVCS